ncbi:unnamed protein product [Cylindrotheca closterium]|uniref:Kinesin light chain n=1 Tax=Cylindrotheca closterium TaxID=2856 RepID=A0AAD2FT53_9STRA|nr:unnamed protein product [Cylindrotheca closterium]
MICRTDPRVKLENERKQKARYQYSDKNFEDPSKTCLVIPGINNHKRPLKQPNARAVSSQSSTASDNSNSDYWSGNASGPYTNERKLLLNNSNQTTTDWYGDDKSVESAQPTTERFNLGEVNPPPDMSPDLLQLPKPTDRSHQARRQQHAYQGETEPAGSRGQEAGPGAAQSQTQTRTRTSAGKPSIPVRNFSGDGDGDDSVFDGVIEVGRSKKAGQSVISGLTSASPNRFSPQQPQRPQNYRTNGYAAEARERRELMQHNLTEISQEDAASRQQPPSPIHPMNNNNNDGNTSVAPSLGTNSNSTPSFRKSAPVNVDDSSFADPTANVQGIHATAMEHVLRGEYDVALEAFQQVLQVYLTKHGKSHALTASAYHNLGTVHSKRAALQTGEEQQHSKEQALLCFQAAARSARDAPDLGPTHPNVAVSLVRIGFLLLQTQQYKNAGVTFMEALRIRKAHYGHNHSLVANLYNNLGVCHMHSQEFEKGRDLLQQALDIQRILLQQEPSNAAMLELADTLCNIGGLCLEWVRQHGSNPRHMTDAERSFAEALQIRAGTLGQGHGLTAQVRALYEMAKSNHLPPRADPVRAPTPSSASQSSRSPSGRSTRSTATAKHANVGPPINANHANMGPPNTANHPNMGPPKRAPPRQAYPQYSTPIVASNTVAPKTPVRGQPLKFSADTPTGRSTRTADLSPWSRAAKDAFDPFKEGSESNDEEEFRRQQQAEFGASPFDGMPTSSKIAEPPKIARASNDSEMSIDEELDLIETEESCLLQSDSSGQSTTLISFAETAADQADSTLKQNDRSALLNTTKALLDGGNGAVPPTVTTNAKATPRELGLAPLRGNWPGGNNNRITPAVLENPAKHLGTVYNCAVNFMRRQKYMEALHLFEIIEEIQREWNSEVHEHVASSVYNLGICHLKMHSYYKAMQSFEETTRIRHTIQGRNSPFVAASLVKVGVCLLQLKRLEDALWIFREALSVRETNLGGGHPLTAKVKNNIGCAHVEMHQFELARDVFESALEAQQAHFLKNPNDGPTLFAIATTLQNLGSLHQKQGETEYAIRALNEALQVKEKVLGPDHTAVLGTIDAIAETWLDSGNSAMSLKFYKEHMDRLTSSHGTLEEASTLFKVSRVHLKRRDVVSQQKALQMAVRVLQSDPSTMGSDGRFALEKRIQQDMKAAIARSPDRGQNRSWV